MKEKDRKTEKRIMRLRFQKGDLLAVGIVLVTAAAVGLAFLPLGKNTGRAAVQIWQDGGLLYEVPLDQDQTFEVTGKYTTVIEIRGGKAAVLSSDCPGEDCVHSGAVSVPGRSIVCLPNGVEVRITGETEQDSGSEVDFSVG